MKEREERVRERERPPFIKVTAGVEFSSVSKSRFG